MYAFSDFIVYDNLTRLKVEDHIFKLNLHKNTYVKAMTYGFSRGAKSIYFFKFGDTILGHVGEDYVTGK